MITSWTRLVCGNWRDPLVGRHVFIGVLAGALYMAVLSAGTTLLVWFNTRVQFPRAIFPLGDVLLTGDDRHHGGTCPRERRYDLVFLLFLVRAVTRRRWVAELAVTIVFGALRNMVGRSGVRDHLGLDPRALVARGSGGVCIRNHTILQGFPMTFHPSDWYFSRTLIGLALCLGLAVYGFYTSSGGKSAFAARGVLSFSDE